MPISQNLHANPGDIISSFMKMNTHNLQQKACANGLGDLDFDHDVTL